MALELGGGDPVPVRTLPGWEGGDDLLLAEPLDRYLRRQVLGKEREGDIDPALEEVAEQVTGGPLLPLDLDTPVGLAEPDEHVGDIDLARGHGGADPDLAPHESSELIHLVAKPVDLIQDAAGPSRHRLTRPGDDDAAAIAAEQPRPEL